MRERSWDERLQAVHHQYPSTSDDWRAALGDYQLVATVLRDVLRVGHTPKRRGQRPLLEHEDGMARLRQLFGDDVTMRPFAEAFTILVGPRSVREVAERTGLAQQRCRRLLSGETAPSGRDMELVAAGFGKPAVYWVEYRAGLVAAAVAEQMCRAPEASVGFVRQLGTVREA